MTPEPIQLSITNICEGGVPEVFMREVRAVLENIADINTSPDGKRKITLVFEFEPTADRRPATVSFQCSSNSQRGSEGRHDLFRETRGEDRSLRLRSAAGSPVRRRTNEITHQAVSERRVQ